MNIAGFGSFDYTQIGTTVKTEPTQKVDKAETGEEKKDETKPQKSFNELTPEEKQQVA